MTQVAYVSMALAIGLGSALQVGMLASLGRERGSFEATWMNAWPSLIGLSVLFMVRTLADNPPSLPSPLDGFAPYIAVLAVTLGILVFSMQGLPAYLGFVGVFGFAYVMAASFLAPKLGIALFYSAASAGTLAGGVALDHFGAFGSAAHHITVVRVIGLAALLFGILLVRSGR
jgi:uncharacterized membrane protein YdcZ (DUF606 family)